MNRRLRFLFLLFLICQAFHPCLGEKKASAQAERLESFFRKKETTIAVTDSGLGGLSIMADAVERMREYKIFRRVNFVFFNALFSEGGYNSLKTREEKIQIFDSALRSLEKNYRPDLTLIGCNTLSVIYDDTTFSKKTSTAVVGIVESGVELLAQSLEKSPDSRAIIFATPTTVGEEAHRKRLEEMGFSSERIVFQACPELVSYIERGYASEETEMLVAAYVDEALQKIKGLQSPLYVSLSCTHYGYSLELWKKAFLDQGITPKAFLNPNSKMIDFLFEPQRRYRFKSTEISAHVISMVEIRKETIDSIGKWLNRISLPTAEALLNYELRPGLFEWKRFVISER